VVVAPPAIVTTQEEYEAYYIIKSILRDTLDSKRVVIRDQQSYCGILLDDNNRKPICRLYFNGTQKQIALLDNEQKKEVRVSLKVLDDIYSFADRLKTTVALYK